MNRALVPGGTRLLRAAATVLARSGIESSRLDSELLLAFALGTSRHELFLQHPERVPRAARRRFVGLIRARAGHAPVAYLVGRKEFRGLEFRVDARVLVPRPETELLAAAAIAWLSAQALERPRVLDLGCGTCCLAVSIALECEASVVTATDVSATALEVARANVDALAPGRVRLKQGDLFGAVEHDPPFDLIVSNPPYVAVSELAVVDRAVRDHEPRSAWLSGEDALSFHRRIFAEGGSRLSPDGAIMLEVGSGAEEILALGRSAFPEARSKILSDLAGMPRVVVIDRSRDRSG